MNMELGLLTINLVPKHGYFDYYQDHHWQKDQTETLQNFVNWWWHVQFPSDLIFYIFWCYLFWRGTKYQVLFSKKNYKILGVMSVLYLSFDVFMAWYTLKIF